MNPRRVPRSTYRLQLTSDFDLFEAARRLPYLHELGVDWVYLSPLLAAEAGSDHGYDVAVHTREDPERGGSSGLEALASVAHGLDMGVLVDIVPNHVGVANPRPATWWWDVLEHGPGSRFASYFDIDWEAGGGRLLLPVVGDGDEGSVEVLPEERAVVYHDLRLPMAPGSTDLAAQHYELVSWRRGDSELNYRRFFTVTTLAGLRVEDPEVFEDSHGEIRRWFEVGLVDGLRVDHPDGLRDPGDYLDRLAKLTDGSYVVVEKILEPGESLPSTWATAGTTGYDVLALVDRVLTDPGGEAELDDVSGSVDFAALSHDTKRSVADGSLQAEVRRIVRELPPDGLPDDLVRDAVAELLACFPVYRSYLPLGVEHLVLAFATARARRPDLLVGLDALEPVLSDPAQPAALRFQQTSGMVMAKGVEDCAFYRHSRLTSLNEVGGDPGVFSLSVEEFHEAMVRRQAGWPDAMTALSTHDTKRSEDVRARLAVLAEVPSPWAAALELFLRQAPLPDPVFGNLLWQAAVGAWPISRERLHAYAEKAMREAGDHTTWTDPDEDYERAVHAAVDAAYDDEAVGRTIAEVVGLVEGPGRSNSLSAKLLSLTLPGVPDVYQGSELGDLSLVDPDNRRPVDFDEAEASLARGDNPKQALTARALRLRRDRPELFTSYAPLSADGEAAEHVLAFDRGGAVTVVTRLPLGLARKGGWGDTTLALTDGSSRRVADLLGDQPAVVLVPEDLS
ncbi:MAG TPA: malto-oligosyltrehalose synthase [Nocardioides sp.]|uniref:malto-oligosyltrehalose synthase n=1 Tax=Nocardioides sp. TaxID=35761 RepID=UPI002E2F0B44|nr:malto-oligosyltrehalose synthase [Nocardioides sp.]HEX5087582.1 malto-oligosyltrehalose synthase [Nocardioides sp.]